MFDVLVTAVGGLVLIIGLCSRWVRRAPTSAPILALLAGVLLGPVVLGVVDPFALCARPVILGEAARMTLAVGLVGVALRIPPQYPREHPRELLTLVGLSMLLMWAIGTALVYLILPVPFWLAAVVGAVVTPTDPIVAGPIVTGALATKHIPERVRHAISFESGSNDGLAYPFTFLAFLLLTRPAGDALQTWAVHTVVWEVGAATVFGLGIGYVSGRLLLAAEGRGTVGDEWHFA